MQRLAVFLFPGMWSVIGSYSVYLSTAEGHAQGHLVGLTFHRRIAFDERAQLLIIFFRKHKVSNASLGSYLLLIHRLRAEQGQLTSSAQVGNVQACASLCSQFHSQFGRLVASLAATDDAMHPDRQIQMLATILLSVLIDDVLVLTVSHNHLIGASKDTFQALCAVHQHATRAAAHEELHTRRAMAVELPQQVVVGIGSSEKAGIIHHTFLRH